MTIAHSSDLFAPTNQHLVALVRARLLAERHALLIRTEPSVVEHEPQATTGSGETDHINLAMERQVAAALDAHARDALDDNDDALARLEDGTYGRCASCRTTIDMERIVALPRVRACIDCQRKRASDRRLRSPLL